MDKKYDLTCDQCGARMIYNENRTEIHCEYCGNVIILPSTEDAEKIAYAKRKAEVDANNHYYEKKERAERRRLNVGKLIGLLIVLSIVASPIICTGIVYIFKPVINPFDYINVSFEGIDGEGVAKVELIKSDSRIQSLDDLGVEVSKQYNLSEGEKITVYTNTLESPCWHSESSRDYTVAGLELFLTDLNDMDENVIKLINQKSQQLFEKATDNESQFTNIKHEKFYLLSDGAKENLLYDVFECTWELIEGYDKTIYFVAYYENIITHNGDYATFSYEDCMYTGNLLYEGSYSNGYVYGFESLDDIELDLNTNHSPNMVLTSTQ